ncbi:MAG: hypothetical protein CM1200mP41_36910 [Gammaproteobacteria bacterium]|nr:MAG: hypothetical protein CM1200mP41_36910 [Gammaproteobacteria bacterium]
MIVWPGTEKEIRVGMYRAFMKKENLLLISALAAVDGASLRKGHRKNS